MEELLSSINKRISELNYPNINPIYLEYMKRFNSEFKFPYDEVSNDIYPIFITLLCTSDLGIEKFEYVDGLIKRCGDFFKRIKQYDWFDLDFCDSFIENYYESQKDKSALHEFKSQKNRIILRKLRGARERLPHLRSRDRYRSGAHVF